MWCSSRIGFPAAGDTVAFSRAYTIVLPGADSYRVTAIPSRSKIPARKSAAFRVSPGGFDVSIATYSRRSRVASSGSWARIHFSFTTMDTMDTKIHLYKTFLCVRGVLRGDAALLVIKPPRMYR